jgi:alpha-L-rhamnosidase
MVLWTTRSNVHSVMTDCPARERCGWLGDAHVAAEMSIYNYDMAQFWTKFMFDIETSLGMGYATYTGRKATPGIPCNIAPGKRQCQEARPDWGSAIVLLPYYMYLYYGDADMLEHHYPHMKRWIEYAGKYAEDNIVVEGYGDWAPPGGNVAIRCPVPLTSTAYYYWTIELLADMAEQLGKTDDAAQLRDQAAVVKSAFIAKFLDKEARSYGSQTANIMALRLGLIPDGMEDDIAESLVQEIEVKHKGHHTTGIHGTRHLYWALSEYGYDDTAFGILTNTGFPSYSDLFERGATTMWEVMAKQSKTGRQPGVSHNHPMHCGFDAWFYSGILGIAPSPMAPGFKHIDMKPSLQNELEWAKGIYDTLRGRIESHWRNVDGSFVWDIGIPPNTTATVRIPAKSIESVRESGLPASQAPGVKYLQMEDGMAVFAIGSGNYQFTAARRMQLNMVPGTTQKR